MYKEEPVLIHHKLHEPHKDHYGGKHAGGHNFTILKKDDHHGYKEVHDYDDHDPKVVLVADKHHEPHPFAA